MNKREQRGDKMVKPCGISFLKKQNIQSMMQQQQQFFVCVFKPKLFLSAKRFFVSKIRIEFCVVLSPDRNRTVSIR
jgi:hypothetical protein